MSTNIPVRTSSALSVNNFFNKFYNQTITFPSNQIDAVVGFFLKNNFDVESAKSTAIVLLNQAKVDKVNVFQLIDSLKVLSEIQLSQVVAQILNSYRESTSYLGHRTAPIADPYEARNILV